MIIYLETRFKKVQRSQIGQAGDGVESVSQLPSFIAQSSSSNVQLFDELFGSLKSLRVNGRQLGTVVELDTIESEIVEEIAWNLADGRVLEDELVESFLPAQLAQILAQPLEVNLQSAGRREGKLLSSAVSIEHVLHAKVFLSFLTADESSEFGLDPLPVVHTVLTSARPDDLLWWTLANIGHGQVQQAGQTEQRIFERLLLQLGVESSHFLDVRSSDVKGIWIDEFQIRGAIKVCWGQNKQKQRGNH